MHVCDPLTKAYVIAPLLVPPTAVRITVEPFLTEINLLEILNGLCEANVNETSTAELSNPVDATTWQVATLVAVKSVPTILQFGVLVEKMTLALFPPVVVSFTTDPDG